MSVYINGTLVGTVTDTAALINAILPIINLFLAISLVITLIREFKGGLFKR